MVNINNLNGIRREYPSWNERGRIRKVDEHGNFLEGQHAFGGEVVRISPRRLRNGANYRVRPERPAAFFAAFCAESGLLPTPLTPEESESDWGLEVLQPLWDAYKHHLPRLESPFAACDSATEPSLRAGYSFCLLQVLVELIGTARPSTSGPAARPAVNGSGLSSRLLDHLRKKIEEGRARAAVQPKEGPEAPPVKATADQPTAPPKSRKG